MKHLLELAIIASALATAQLRFPMRYLDEVGHLGGLDTRKFSDLGIAKVHLDPDGLLRIEGKDDAGKYWRVHVPPSPGITYTDVWSADFDHNGRKDLLIAAHQVPNGRCVDVVDLTFLLFDSIGRPVPWRVLNNHNFREKRNGHLIPAIFLDLNYNGHAELVVSGCEYSGPSDRSRFGEDRRLMGVYEAQQARWIPVRDTRIAPYERIAQAFKYDVDLKWLPPDPPDRWPDQLSGLDSPGNLRMEHIIPRDPECHGIRMPIVDGSVVMPERDPCDILGRDRIAYSDGATLKGWPNVIFDGPAGREIYIHAAYPPDDTILQRILRDRLPLKRLGNPTEPDWLWVSTNPSHL